ncbi:MAG TPA: DUF4132 domain-containing protein [Kofleriaceae bacterium]|jgi:hypothetical protein|nr:DUF4132 domain-containing protein [Kofleriaceae bacterium]
MARATSKGEAKNTVDKRRGTGDGVADPPGASWVDAGGGYSLTLEAGKLVCRSPKGVRLASVPKEIKDGEAAEQLGALRDWLGLHDQECISTVDTWMLRSLPVPRATVQAVWDDPSWRKPLENAVVVPVARDGTVAADRAGFLRGVDPNRGVGVVDLDGETVWLDTDQIAIPHPILLTDLDGLRELATQLALSQGIAQLHRETWRKPDDVSPSQTSIAQFADGKFAMLMHAIGRARSQGYRVRGGFAVCAVWEGGDVVEARYWIGSDSPDTETWTGELSWVDGRERSLKIGDLGAVAYSEGMRMASAIWAGRVVEKDDAA